MDLREGYAKLYALGVPSNRTLLPQWTLRMLPFFLKKAGVTGGTFLDLGCGPGHASNLLSLAGMEGVGVDIDPHMLKYARRLYPHCTFRGDVGDVADRSLVLMFHDVVNALAREDALKAIREAPVSADGRLIFDITTRKGFERWPDLTGWERDDICVHEHGVLLDDTAVLQISGFASFEGDGKFERFRTTVRNFFHDPNEVREVVEARFPHVRYFDNLGQEGWNLEANKIVVVASSVAATTS